MRPIHALTLLTAILTLASACADDDDDGSAVDPADGLTDPITFYASPGAMDAGEPGELIDEQPVALADLTGTGVRVTYASTTPSDEIVHVTGVLIVPEGDAGPDGRPVAVWGHPTVGVGTACAPSLEEPFALEGVQPLLDAGFIVAAPDYDGLGSEGTHPYLVGESEARAMLDIARVARPWGGNDTVVTWGHSQGGHAALWARSLVAEHAPELDLRATAAAAPPTDLAAFLDRGFTDSLILPITAQTAIAWGTVHDNVELAPLATPETLAAATAALESCIIDIAALAADADPGEVWAQGPDAVPAWGALTAANSVDPDRGSGPVLISHGEADAVVPIDGSRDFAQALCAAGETVILRTDAGWSHGTGYTEPRAEMIDWLIAVASGEEPSSEC